MSVRRTSGSTRWSEDSLHRWLAGRATPRALVGALGHDASVLALRAGGRAPRGVRAAVSVDQTIEGVHFERRADPRLVGRKAVLRTLSDLAATAAAPRAVWLALTAPRERAEAWMRALIGGVIEAAREHGAELLGGDLAAAPGGVRLAVTALGEPAAGRAPPNRSLARAGQVVLLTGPVGGSLLGRHLAIEPRIAAGRWLAERGARAMIDVSDGLALDLARVARLSRVAIDLELARVPVHEDALRAARASGKGALLHALSDGEDHELVATVGPRALARVLAEAPGIAPRLAVIGRVRAGTGLWLCPAEGRARRYEIGARAEGGFLHGR